MTIGLILTVIFIILKLCGVIQWTWFQVLLPEIIELSIVVLFLAIIGFFYYEEWKGKRRK